MTTDFLYLRLIGDRSISEKDFGIIQKERKLEMERWSNIFKDIKNNEAIVKTAVMSANNHYAGFGPMTAKIFGEMVDLNNKISFLISDYKPPSEILEDKYYSKFEDLKYKKTRQSSMSDFLNNN